MKFESDMGIEEIKIIENFLSQDEIDMLISYINKKIDIFITDDAHGETRHTIMFGKDSYYGERSEVTLDKIKEIEPILRNDIFPRVELAIKKAYDSKKDLMVCSFFLAKQSKGAVVPEHVDTDGGLNMHFKYGGVIYLNSMQIGGKLKFTGLNYEYTPKPGDLVVFPSKPYQYRHTVEEINEDRYSLPIWVTEYELWKI
jgi:hypothetical protein